MRGDTEHLKIPLAQPAAGIERSLPERAGAVAVAPGTSSAIDSAPSDRPACAPAAGRLA